jgi:HPt (histidine-containing phosphotransfer) domain-containing protein
MPGRIVPVYAFFAGVVGVRKMTGAVRARPRTLRSRRVTRIFWPQSGSSAVGRLLAVRPAMQMEQSTLDYTVVESLRELQEPGGPDLLEQLTAAFVEDAQNRLSELQQAVSTANHSDVRRIAHSLKGMCGAIGAPLMAALSAELERSALAARVDPELAARLTGEFTRVAAALEAL